MSRSTSSFSDNGHSHSEKEDDDTSSTGEESDDDTEEEVVGYSKQVTDTASTKKTASNKKNYKQQIADAHELNKNLMASLEKMTDNQRRGQGVTGLKLEKPMKKRVLTIVQHYSFYQLPFVDANLFYGRSNAMDLVTEKLSLTREKAVTYSASLCQTFLDKTNYLRAQALGRVKAAYLRTYHSAHRTKSIMRG